MNDGFIALGVTLIDRLTRPPPALSAERIASLVGTPKTAILVLGAGRKLEAPEYRALDLKPLTAGATALRAVAGAPDRVAGGPQRPPGVPQPGRDD